MRSRTLYFSPSTNERLGRIRAHLPGANLSRLIAAVLAIAEREIEAGSHPPAFELPPDLPPTRHTVYLDDLTDRRLERLQTRFQPGSRTPITASEALARAFELAEPKILLLREFDVELLYIESDAIAVRSEVLRAQEELPAEAIGHLLALMLQTADLLVRTGQVRSRIALVDSKNRSPAWTKTFELMTGTLSPLMHYITQVAVEVRNRSPAEIRTLHEGIPGDLRLDQSNGRLAPDVRSRQEPTLSKKTDR